MNKTTIVLNNISVYQLLLSIFRTPVIKGNFQIIAIWAKVDIKPHTE